MLCPRSRGHLQRYAHGALKFRPGNVEIVAAYIAMLRGINVSGQKIVRMQDLRELCAVLGFRSVATYLQSGNIVFLNEEKPSFGLSKGIGEAILHEFGFAVPVFVKTLKEMKGVIEGNPFLKERGIDRSKLHVTFLAEAAPQSARKNLERLPAKRDQFCVGRQQIYLYCPDGYGNTKFSNTALEKVLCVAATTRNWKTVSTLYEMASKLS
jgi:uncharacterized protein (DUF1697 family)